MVACLVETIVLDSTLVKWHLKISIVEQILVIGVHLNLGNHLVKGNGY